MLPLGRAFLEPGVIGQVEQDIRVIVDGGASRISKSILEADQYREVDIGSTQPERHHGSSCGKTALNRGKPFQERQPADQGNVFAKDHQLPLVVAGLELPLGRHQKAAVIVKHFIGAARIRRRLDVIRTHDDPGMMAPSQLAGFIKDIGIVADKTGQTGFRPHQHIGLGLQGFFGKAHQLFQACRIILGLPDQRLSK
eukprot:TRINITY_DN7694_c0_g1_i1.p2 TRINITY_DN7694_c0_g1~~TRINITY_DN7694_c0_g1_i1.p2  ORF type:complete len:197 (+),score=-0.21 TRINITY_DN7694_c0_g1_i1:155-745(+)